MANITSSEIAHMERLLNAENFSLWKFQITVIEKSHNLYRTRWLNQRAETRDGKQEMQLHKKSLLL